MRCFQFLLRAIPAALLLVLCLQLEVSDAQENTRRILIFDFDMPDKAKANEEINVKLKLETELRECMVVKAYLKSDVPVQGAFNYKYTRCLCADSPVTFIWDFHTDRTLRIAAVVDIVKETGICTEDMAVIPIKANRYYKFHTLAID
uniref:Prolactin-inducible protein homolog n=1 Tax=Castor canadensis TaxID=51338 RepID=A0A8B7TRV1_CASCN|nr:prolactin-inducible protein [Castor canadensis]